MQEFPLIFSLWALVSLCLCLVWYIFQLNKTMADERERNREEREEMRADMETERKNLYDRIQAGTLPQYKDYADAPNEVEETEDETIDLADARDELMGVNNE